MGGGGIKRGEVVGATNALGEFVIDSPVTPQDLAATIYTALGIPLHTWYRAAGRPADRAGAGRQADPPADRLSQGRDRTQTLRRHERPSQARSTSDGTSGCVPSLASGLV